MLTKNRIIFNNDPHRELILFPPEDVLVGISLCCSSHVLGIEMSCFLFIPLLQQSKIGRQCRTTRSTVPPDVLHNDSNYFTIKCAQFYTCDWFVLSFKYKAYSGSYLALPKYESEFKLLVFKSVF